MSLTALPSTSMLYSLIHKLIGNSPMLCHRAMLVYRQLRRFDTWLRHRDGAMFKAVQIEINTDCNRRCTYCPNATIPMLHKEMSQETYDIILAQLRQKNFRGSITYCFNNEPTLDPRLISWISKAHREVPRAMIWLASNGDYLTAPILESLRNAGCRFVRVTMHEPVINPALYDLEKQFRGFLHLSKIHFHWMMNRGGTADIGDAPVMTNCAELIRQMLITYNGDVLLCCNDCKRQHVMGNVHSTTLDWIWYSYKFWQIRRELWRENYSFTVCQRCMGLRKY